MPLPAAAKGKGKGSSFVAAVSSAFKGKGSASASGSGSSAPPKGPPKDDWKHNADYVRRTVELLMPPPIDSSPSATMAVQRELKAMLKEQEKALTSAGGLKELGWYMPEEFIGDNLFQWIVEMHSFDETLPIAKDLKRECVFHLTCWGGAGLTDSCRKVNSLIFEIRFPPTYPIGPPFFRIITPRFLPFIQGGGGHVTGGPSHAFSSQAITVSNRRYCRRVHLYGPADVGRLAPQL
jgi:ubiquitin-conjugating enzyme E2 Q